MSNKTVANSASVSDFINSIQDAAQKSDVKTLLGIFSEISNETPKMWGSSLIGFGEVRLTYASGRVVDWLKIGLSPRKGKISLYVTFDAEALTSQFPNLGTYTTGKGCIYIKRLSDVDQNELTQLVRKAYDSSYETA